MRTVMHCPSYGMLQCLQWCLMSSRQRKVSWGDEGIQGTVPLAVASSRATGRQRFGSPWRNCHKVTLLVFIPKKPELIYNSAHKTQVWGINQENALSAVR